MAAIGHEEFRELRLQSLGFGNVADLNVWIVWVLRRVVLVVVLSFIKAFEGSQLGGNFAVKSVCSVELVDVRLGDLALLIRGIEDSRAIAGADVRPLTIQLRRVMSN